MPILTQRTRPLEGGAHAGPLFVPRLQRGLMRPKGKEGVVHRAQTVRATPRWLSEQDQAVKGPWTWPNMWNEQLELLEVCNG